MQVCPAVIAISLGLVLAGCGSETQDDAADPPQAAPSVEAPYLTSDGEPIVSCGGGDGWPVSAMKGEFESSVDRAEIVDALERLVDDAGMDAPTALQGTEVDSAEWFVLNESETSVSLASGPWTPDGPAEGAQVVGLELVDGSWKATGWGDCHLEPVLPGNTTWARALKSRTEIDPSSATVPVRVMEMVCTSSRDPTPYLHEPVVVETADSVIVYWTTTPPDAATCPGNPAVDREITLAEPLGDRVLMDGSTWPPAKLANSPY